MKMNADNPVVCAERGRPFFMVFRLAMSDLVHEWILSMCLLLAVTAVLAPLLILFGLKYGIIETMRLRLTLDPRNREIRPLVGKSFDRRWLEEIKKRLDVAFISPTTRQLSTTVNVYVKNEHSRGEPETLVMDITPSGPGDVLLLENGAPIPDSGQCVLSTSAAEELAAGVGDIVIVEVTRIRNNRPESGRLELKVAGTLRPRAGGLQKIYTRLDVLEAVERFKDGMAVLEYGWAGSIPEAYPRFDGVVVILPRRLKKTREIPLINNTGFTRIEPLGPEELPRRAGYRLASPGEKAVYLLSNRGNPAGRESIEAVERRLRGMGAVLIPWVRNLNAELIGPAGESISALHPFALSIPPEKAGILGIRPSPAWIDADDHGAGWRKLMLPDEMGSPTGPFKMRIHGNDNSVEFPVEVVAKGASSSHSFIPVRLAGVLNLLHQRDIQYKDDIDKFIVGRRGYAGFRLYSRSIDDVDPLRKHLEGQGIQVHTRAERIRDVTELDRSLTLIFQLIASVGLVGGIASLTASLYASVERKRRELSVLRLLGLSGGALFRFPIYQGVCIMAGGFTIAFIIFHVLAGIINELFGRRLQDYESLCRLSTGHFIGIFVGLCVIAMLAGTLAAWRGARIDPAEALRDE